jgi:hypothetical protein
MQTKLDRPTTAERVARSSADLDIHKSWAR